MYPVKKKKNALIAITTLVLANAARLFAHEAIAPGDNLTADNIPPIPVSLAESAKCVTSNSTARRKEFAVRITSIFLGLLSSALAIALSPDSPRPVPKPALPKIDQKACPFEGCHLGKWRARERIKMFSTWKERRKLVRVLHKGKSVVAVMGIYVTYKPSEIEVTAPIPEYDLKTGDIVFGYMSVGEGFFNAWFKGHWVEEFDGSGIVYADGSGCSHKCDAKLLKEGRGEWWVQVKTKDGLSGWTKDGDKFDGNDALAGPVGTFR
jgi:hypothetical protein